MTDNETGLLRERVVSIDALRGFDMFFLIGGFAIIRAVCDCVQTPSSDALAAQLKHTDWHGFHFVDLIFPMFLFLVGASMAVSYFVAALIVVNTGVRGQAFAAVSLLLAYWALMTCVPVPGHGAGVLTPEGSLAGYVDQLFLPGRFHRDMPYDEDGILSQIPSTASVLLGTRETK